MEDFVKISKIFQTQPINSIILVRLIVGAVFLSEGIQKFLFPETLGIGRFINIGIPVPEFFAPFDGVFEVLCGTLIIIGFFTKLASIPMIINMIVAISTTKIPILLNDGFWKMAHEARTDWSMLLGLIFLLIVGSGKLSIDYIIFKNMNSKKE